METDRLSRRRAVIGGFAALATAAPAFTSTPFTIQLRPLLPVNLTS